MKIETKLKILHWVEKLIKWNPTDGMRLIITQEKRTIQIARVCHIIPKREINMISEEQVQFASGMAILSEIEKEKVIQFTREKVDEEHTNVIAKLKIVMP